MNNLWRCLEAVPGLVAVPSVWADGTGADATIVRSAFLRDTGRMAKSYPCQCGCAHEVVEHEDGRKVGVCRCEPWNCDDVELSAEHVRLLEFNRAKFGREVCHAFGCESKRPPSKIPVTWEAGTFAGLSVFMTIQYDEDGFRRSVSELVARQRQPFILLAPTKRFLDAECKELLATARAGFFDLATNLVVATSGALHARKRGGELFTPYLPEKPESAPEDVARAAWAMVLKLDSGKSRSEPSAVRVFKHYCREGLSADKLALKYGWAKGTVMNRLKEIEKATGMDKQQLRGLSDHFERMEEEMSDDRASHIHRTTQVHGLEDPEDEKA